MPAGWPSAQGQGGQGILGLVGGDAAAARLGAHAFRTCRSASTLKRSCDPSPSSTGKRKRTVYGRIALTITLIDAGAPAHSPEQVSCNAPGTMGVHLFSIT